MSDHRSSPRTAILSLVVLMCCAGAARAHEGVLWRLDYAAARREAEEKQRPIVMVCGSSNCFWCNKLEASTLRDPDIVKQLNEQFIPIKIEVQSEPELFQSLQIQRYPTIVFGAPDGRILEWQVGYAEADSLGQQLNRTLRNSAPSTP